MNVKSLMMLVLAISFGLGAMMLTRQFLSDDSGRREEDTQELVVAARDFKEEETLKPDMVKLVRMAKSAVPAGSFSAAKDVEDRWVRTAMLEGDVLVEKKLGPKGSPPGLVANIPKGMRAYAIDVTEQTGVSGFILPGHRVDVIRYAADQNEQRGETILQDVPVLATGQLFIRPEEKAVQSRTVTLALNPVEVDTLVAARARGTLCLSLRGVNDHAVVERAKPKPPDEAQEKRWKLEEEKRLALEKEVRELKESLAKKAAETPPAPAPAPVPLAREPRFVWIYRGGREGRHEVQQVRIDEPATLDRAPAANVAAAPVASGRPPRPAFERPREVAAIDEPGS